jgi:hypothetical protein
MKNLATSPGSVRTRHLQVLIQIKLSGFFLRRKY